MANCLKVIGIYASPVITDMVNFHAERYLTPKELKRDAMGARGSFAIP
ncbi:MAG: hypothetical protein E7L08_03845 [Klebsiella michiganensis]|nr:hypothetical protein [Klebsiella michiganensis]